MPPKEHPILEALRLFDPANDDQWTSDGLPLVDLLTGMVGRPVTRREVNQLAPTFNRTSAATFFGFDAPKAPAAAGTPAAPADQGGSEAEEDPFADAPPSGAPAADPAKRASEPARGPSGAPDAPQAQPEPFPREADKAAGAVRFGIGAEEPKDIQDALDQIEERLGVLIQERRVLNAEIEALQNRSQLLSRLQERGRKANPRENQDHIQFYLAGTAKRREEQAARAKALTEAGLTPAVLAAAINTKSKLDSAMTRRTGYGNKRPVHPIRDAS